MFSILNVRRIWIQAFAIIFQCGGIWKRTFGIDETGTGIKTGNLSAESSSYASELGKLCTEWARMGGPGPPYGFRRTGYGRCRGLAVTNIDNYSCFATAKYITGYDSGPVIARKRVSQATAKRSFFRAKPGNDTVDTGIDEDIGCSLVELSCLLWLPFHQPCDPLTLYPLVIHL